MRVGVAVVFLLYVAVGQCQLFDTLYSHLMSKGAKNTIPVSKPNEALDVSFSLNINQVNSLNTETGDADFDVWLITKWQDERLAWNPEEYSDLTKINLPYDSVWTPDVVTYNARLDLDPYPKVVSANGEILQVPKAIVFTRCNVNDYMSDNTVTCMIKFGSWTYSGNLLNLTSDNTGAETTYFQPGRWEITQNTMKRNAVKYDCCPETYIDLEYTLVFRDTKTSAEVEEEDE